MQKKRLLILSILLLTELFIQVTAQTVSPDKALQVARMFNTLLKNNEVCKHTLRNDANLQLIYTDLGRLQNTRSEQTASYYLFDRGDEKGFILVAGDERAYPILGYGTSGDCSLEAIPENLKGWLEGYAREIRYARDHNIPGNEDVQILWNKVENFRLSTNRSSENILKTANWGQGNPYNLLCVDSQGRHFVTGCVFTASGIIMKYHNYPDYIQDEKFPNQQIPLNWGSMPDNYIPGKYTGEQAQAVAFLLSTLGKLGKASYGYEETSGNPYAMAPVFITNFHYDPNIFYANRDHLKNDNAWKQKIRTEIDARRPILYSGTTEQWDSSHAFVIDGYQGDNFHVNWGWDGKYNGYYLLNALTPATNSNYSYHQDMIAQISPLQADTTLTSLFIFKDHTDGNQGRGLYTNVSQIQKDQPFILHIDAIASTAFKDIKHTLRIAHTSVDGIVKEWISKEYFFQTGNHTPIWKWNFDCELKEAISPGDRIYLCAKDSAHPEFRIVKGFGLSNHIALNDDFYFDIIYEDCSGVSLIPEEGFTMTAHQIGKDFRFKLKTEESHYYGTATYNGQILKSDANNIFTIPAIKPGIPIKLGKEFYPTELSLQISSGSLPDAIPEEGLSFLQALTLSGTADFNDFTFLRNKMPGLRKIDLGNLQIDNPGNLLPAQAFSGMKQLTHLVLPATLEQVGEYCFFQCPLKQLCIQNVIPPTLLGTSYFAGLENIEIIELLIPENAIAAYKADKDWSRFLLKPDVPTGNQNAITKTVLSIRTEGNNLQIRHPQNSQESLLIVNILGEKILQQTLKGTYTNVSLPGKGFYIVKIGTTCRKIFIAGK